MPAEPIPADPGWDGDPAWSRPDPVSAEDREAWLDHLAAQDEPFDPEEWLDPEGPLGARDRLEAHVAARKLAMVAELTGGPLFGAAAEESDPPSSRAGVPAGGAGADAGGVG